MQAGVSPVGPVAALPRVDVGCLDLVRPRSAGVEHVACGPCGRSVCRPCSSSWACPVRSAPPSSAASWHWLHQRSALSELLGCDFETMGRNALQCAIDRLLRHRETIGTRLLQRAIGLFDLQVHSHSPRPDQHLLRGRGHSREKRHDCPPLTLGLVLDASGFARRSRALAGNVAEGGALQAMPTALDAPPEAAVVLDRGLATEGNVA